MVTTRRKLPSPLRIFALLLVALQSSTAAVYASTASSAGGTYTVLDPPNSTNTQVTGINDYGQVVGFFNDNWDTTHGFLYSGGAYTIIDPPNSVYTQLSGINNSGQIIGNSYDGAWMQLPFLFSRGT